MTLHPWPLTDNTPQEPSLVLWAGSSANGLLTDTLAVPLRFEPASVARVTAPASPPVSQDNYTAALLRICDLEARLGLSSAFLPR